MGKHGATYNIRDIIRGGGATSGHIYTIILHKSVCQCSQTAGRNSCSIVPGDVPNYPYRLTVHHVTSSRLSSAYNFFLREKHPLGLTIAIEGRVAHAAIHEAGKCCQRRSWLSAVGPATTATWQITQMSATSQNGHNDNLFIHGLKVWFRNYYVAHAFVVFININNEDYWLLMLSPGRRFYVSSA